LIINCQIKNNQKKAHDFSRGEQKLQFGKQKDRLFPPKLSYDPSFLREGLAVYPVKFRKLNISTGDELER